MNIPAESVEAETSEHRMRHAADLLGSAFGYGTDNAARMKASDLQVIDFAYQQLLQGADTLHEAQK